MNGTLTLRFKGETRQAVVAKDGSVQVRDGVFRVAPSGHSAWRVTEPSGSTCLVHVASSREGHWVHVDGDVFWIEAGHAEPFDSLPSVARSGHASGHPSDPSGGLSAPMPATVLSIVAPSGTQVTSGDIVLILEAMKMELPIRAPHGGTVTAIHCSEGQLVQPGVPLAEIA